MKDDHEYAVTVQWSSGKRGRASADSLPALEVATPPEFGGPRGIWSREYLLVALVAACVMTTFVAIATNSKLEFSDFEAPANGSLVRGEDRRYRFGAITVRSRIALVREADRERAERILQKAHDLCLISRSLGFEVRFEPRIEVTG